MLNLKEKELEYIQQSHSGKKYLVLLHFATNLVIGHFGMEVMTEWQVLQDFPILADGPTQL